MAEQKTKWLTWATAVVVPVAIAGTAVLPDLVGAMRLGVPQDEVQERTRQLALFERNVGCIGNYAGVELAPGVVVEGGYCVRTGDVQVITTLGGNSQSEWFPRDRFSGAAVAISPVYAQTASTVVEDRGWVGDHYEQVIETAEGCFLQKTNRSTGTVTRSPVDC